MNKYILIVIVLAVIVTGLAGVLLWPKTDQPGQVNNPPSGNSGIQITAPAPNDTVSAPLKITGFIKGDGWTGFEGQVGTVKLFDSNNNELALGILTATEEWMKEPPVNFEITLYFDYPGAGTGTLVFYNENASGEVERNRTFSMPVKLSKSSKETTTVKAYFSTNENAAVDCAKVTPIERMLPKTEGVARAALEVLLLGLTDMEKTAGFLTSIPAGVKIQNLEITNTVAKVDFNDALQKDVAGSCKVTAIRAQIEQTLKQFPTVKSVVISINGKSDDILQP